LRTNLANVECCLYGFEQCKVNTARNLATTREIDASEPPFWISQACTWLQIHLDATGYGAVGITVGLQKSLAHNRQYEYGLSRYLLLRCIINVPHGYNTARAL